MSTRDAIVALRRLGLGARPGEMKSIANDPRGFALGQLRDRTLARLDDPDLDASHVVFVDAQRAQMVRREQRNEAPTISKPPSATASPSAGPSDSTKKTSSDSPTPGVVRRDAFQSKVSARVHRAVTTETPLLERLVFFWSNHFCVSAAKGPVRGLAGAYEREAIRPHVLGRFGDMLKASAQHPAMLIYLDNQISIGPNSPIGKARNRGLNENLAREILELHTLGVASGYTQQDVGNLARILTGWTVGTLNQPQTIAGKFFFGTGRHEPGGWTILGRRYDDNGVAAGEAVLADLVRHPATAKHISRKLARHFHSDTAPPELIARLEEVFLRTEGDLAAVSHELVTSPEIWTAPPAKVVPPFDFAISIVRGLGVRPKALELHRVSAALGQPTWTVPSPKGWPDDDDAWLGPSSVRERLRVAEFVARQVDKTDDPRARAADLFGDAASEETRLAIARAETRDQGIEILMMAPEFLRR